MGQPNPALCTIPPERQAIEATAEFWAHVQVGETNECWPWLLGKTEDGYGHYSILGKQWKAHRVAYAITHGSIPKGLLICHTCDNPPCCNPAHLVAKTYKWNAEDRDKKGRTANKRGEKNERSRITEEQAVFAMARMLTGESQASVARAFNVSPTITYQIWSRKSWKHLWETEYA